MKTQKEACGSSLLPCHVTLRKKKKAPHRLQDGASAQ